MAEVVRVHGSIQLGGQAEEQLMPFFQAGMMEGSRWPIIEYSGLNAPSGGQLGLHGSCHTEVSMRSPAPEPLVCTGQAYLGQSISLQACGSVIITTVNKHLRLQGLMVPPTRECCLPREIVMSVYAKLCQSTIRRAPRSQQTSQQRKSVGIAGGTCAGQTLGPGTAGLLEYEQGK